MSIDRTPGQRPARASRWRSSQVTFGPVGRLVATLLVCLPAVWLLFVGVGVLALPIFAGVLLPWALRDIWRRAPVVTPTHSGPALPSLSDRLGIAPSTVVPEAVEPAPVTEQPPRW